MEFAQPITNNLKKFISSLKNKKERQESGLFIAEGEKLCSELLKSSFKTEMIVLRSNFKSEAELIANEFHKKNIPVYISRKQQFDQLCETTSPQDIIAIAQIASDEGHPQENYIALDGVNDPGNLGTIIRTADWFGFKSIILSHDSVDKYNSKVVRSSMGSIFRMKIIQVTDLAEYIINNFKDYKIFGALLTAKKNIEVMEPKDKFGIVFGSEAHGISESVKRVITHPYLIPGNGGAESLNVGVSVGISLYHFSKYLH